MEQLGIVERICAAHLGVCIIRDTRRRNTKRIPAAQLALSVTCIELHEYRFHAWKKKNTLTLTDGDHGRSANNLP
jgi:hypothetical protein